MEANDSTILFGTVDGYIYSIINNSFQKVNQKKISGDVKDILIINNSEALINGEKINFTSKSNLITKESMYSETKIFTSYNDKIACGFFGFKIIKNDNIIYDDVYFYDFHEKSQKILNSEIPKPIPTKNIIMQSSASCRSGKTTFHVS